MDCFVPAILLIIMLGVLLLVLIIALVKCLQMGQFQRAIRNAWFSQGVCEGREKTDECHLHHVDDLGLPPTAVIKREFDPKLARLLADYVTRIDSSNIMTMLKHHRVMS